MENKVIDLIDDALLYNDYKKRINFLLAGLMSKESNDTEEKQKNSEKWLKEIKAYAECFEGDKEKQEYMKRVYESIENFFSF